ncbi:MAG: LON peptidase substrate-binding domain-containing protein [Pirellulaceae bacterium]
MPNYDQYSQLPPNFSGVVRLFPLPNLVMFPGVLQPLHVFEPRYVEMLEDALAGDRLIAMALLTPGWEKEYEGRPAVSPLVCIGRIASHTQTESGRYNLLLVGARRARIVEELTSQRSFRQARVTPLDDQYPDDDVASRSRLQRKLVEAFQSLLPSSSAAQQQFQQLLAGEAPLGLVTDILAHTLALELPRKLELLEECNVDRRAELLLAAAAEKVDVQDDDRQFPPQFSDN